MVRLGWLAQQSGAELHGDGEIPISRIDTLVEADAGAISFLTNSQYKKHLAETRAGAVILAREHLDDCPCAALLTDDPQLCYARVAALLAPNDDFSPGCHDTAVVDSHATVDASAWIGPTAVIEAGAVIGPRVFVGPGCVVARDVKIGADSRLVSRVTLCHDVVIGERVLIHPGAVIGADGFGLARSPEGWQKIPQLGTVRVGDDVEIGANTTIDRGAIRDTIIERGAKLDNQIQIAHNVRIGEHTAIAACVGISGSTTVGKNCTLGGGVGLAGHLEFADNTHFTGQSLVTRSYSEPGLYSGNMPALPNREWRKAVARFRHLDEMARKVNRLEREIQELQRRTKGD